MAALAKQRGATVVMFPGCAEFAFSILDDTDDTTLRNGPPVYAMLRAHGLRTTKTVWAVDVPPERRGIYHGGETLATPGYLDWVRQLAEEGFEIAFHNASMASSPRHTTIFALDEMARHFRQRVRLHCNHGQNRENLWWGARRYSSAPLRWLGWLRASLRSQRRYEGDRPGSPYYWADIAEDRIDYIRGMSFGRLDGRLIPPGRPYREPRKLLRPVFFNTADAPDVEAFNRLVNPQSIEELRRAGGWAIVSTHFGKGFFRQGELNEQFCETVRCLGRTNGWYVPVSELLDFLVRRDGARPLGWLERLRMESAHVSDRLALGQPK